MVRGKLSQCCHGMVLRQKSADTGFFRGITENWKLSKWGEPRSCCQESILDLEVALERWICCEEPLLLNLKGRAWISETSTHFTWLTHSCTLAPRDLLPSSDLCGHISHNYTHSDIATQCHTQRKEDVKAIRKWIEFKSCMSVLSWQCLLALWVVFEFHKHLLTGELVVFMMYQTH